MHATNKNYKICGEIIELLHKNKVSISQSCAILDYTKNKIAQDTEVGKLIPFDHEVISKSP